MSPLLSKERVRERYREVCLKYRIPLTEISANPP
jgi:hypothetical protein